MNRTDPPRRAPWVAAVAVGAAALGWRGPVALGWPGVPVAPVPPSAAAAAPDGGKQDGAARARRGVVVLERQGHPVALGAVLAGDGRVLTALSPLGDGNGVDARYADGGVVRLRMGHFDRGWDLALMVPQVGRWSEGLTASEADPAASAAKLVTFSTARGAPAPQPIAVKGHRTLVGADDALLRDALDLGSQPAPKDLGAPVVDADAGVVAVVARACQPADGGACAPVAFGAPVSVLRQFLARAPEQAAPPTAWLGVQAVADAVGFARGVRVLVVQADSPADDAGLRGGADRSRADLIVAVDGVPVGTPEALYDAIRKRAPGDRVALLVFGDGKFRVVPVVLRAAPPPAALQPGPPAASARPLPPLPGVR